MKTYYVPRFVQQSCVGWASARRASILSRRHRERRPNTESPPLSGSLCRALRSLCRAPALSVLGPGACGPGPRHRAPGPDTESVRRVPGPDVEPRTEPRHRQRDSPTQSAGPRPRRAREHHYTESAGPRHTQRARERRARHRARRGPTQTAPQSVGVRQEITGHRHGERESAGA